MRTTITLDDDVSRKIRNLVRTTHEPAKKIYNDLLRAALTRKKEKHEKKPFKLITFRGNGLMTGFSWDMSMSQILDKLDEEKFKRSP